jgi:hypothetical protein
MLWDSEIGGGDTTLESLCPHMREVAAQAIRSLTS